MSSLHEQDIRVGQLSNSPIPSSHTYAPKHRSLKPYRDWYKVQINDQLIHNSKMKPLNTELKTDVSHKFNIEMFKVWQTSNQHVAVS